MTDALDKTATAGAVQSPAEAGPGGQLGRYKLIRMIGSGGMGNVWAAHDPDLDREIAIKLLRGAHGEHMRTRLLREARAMARLKHPNVLTVYEVGTVGDRDYIAMELVEGASLDGWLATKPAPADVWDAILGAGRGLAAAHAAGLVHRDFKPHNVLRSRDGRVLVTDFGLARGLGDEAEKAAIAVEETLPAETTAPTAPGLEETLDAASTGGNKSGSARSSGTTGKRTDSVLDSTLTRPGQLLGTPAYMAPEQFAGAPPDPRTDQFAFAITAWQLLTGERPYRGSSIDELRKAAAAGAAGVDAKLPGAVRGVLVRALAPDPRNRWTDMPALLRALERARGLWKRRFAVVVPVVALGLSALLAVKLFGSTKAASDCDPPEHAFDEAWSPARAAEISKRPGMTATVKQLDGFRARWTTAYDRACHLPKEKRPGALSCLYGQRHFLAGFDHMFDEMPRESTMDIDFWGLFPNPDACTRENPVSQPNIGDDPAMRQRALALIAKAYGGLAHRKELLGQEAALLEEARKIGWAPLEGKVLHALGTAAQMENDWPQARRLMARAADVAQQNLDFAVEAQARIAELEITQIDAGDLPLDTVFDDQFARAKAAVHNAGDPPDLLGSLESFRGMRALTAGKLGEAIEIFGATLAADIKLGQLRHTVNIARVLDELLLGRGTPADVERTTQVAQQLRDLIDHGGFTDQAQSNLYNSQYVASWVHHDLATVHATTDRWSRMHPVPGTKVTGRVVGSDGKPVAGARVVAWRGEMFGDGLRVYTDPSFANAVATSGADGSFTVDAPEGGALIAEHDAQRSAPALAAGGAVLALQDTEAVRGKVDVGGESALGLEVFTRVDAGSGNTWAVSTAPAPDGAYELARVLSGMQLGAFAVVWPREERRRISALRGGELHWPIGPALDVIVPAATAPADAAVWVLRGQLAPHTRQEVEALVAQATDRAITELGPIGWGNVTVEGTPKYQRGDRHAVIRDNAPGDLTVCVAAGAEPTAEVHCKAAVVPDSAGELRDGRRWFPAIVVRFPEPQ